MSTTIAEPKPSVVTAPQSPVVAPEVQFPSRAEFRLWREKNQTRGKKHRARECPMAECLRDKGATNPIVGYGTWAYAEGEHGGKTPAWFDLWVVAYDKGREVPA